jgi:hypothetical protein
MKLISLPTRTLLLVFTFSIFTAKVKAQYSEYEVKAAYIFNFAKFIEWPANYLPSDDTIYLCIYQNDPFGIILEKTMIGRKANGKDWKITRIKSLDEIGKCHILVFSEISKHEIITLLEQVKNKPILTIGDEEPDFCQYGGIINFTPQYSEYQFEINIEIATDLKIKISPKLLVLSKIISSKEDEF